MPGVLQGIEGDGQVAGALKQLGEAGGAGFQELTKLLELALCSLGDGIRLCDEIHDRQLMIAVALATIRPPTPWHR